VWGKLAASLVVAVLVGATAWAWSDTVGSGGDGATAAAKPAAASSTPPNIVMILADDQRADQMARMQNVAALASAGVTFDNA
jgi:hypothetical protein